MTLHSINSFVGTAGHRGSCKLLLFCCRRWLWCHPDIKLLRIPLLAICNYGISQNAELDSVCVYMYFIVVIYNIHVFYQPKKEKHKETKTDDAYIIFKSHDWRKIAYNLAHWLSVFLRLKWVIARWLESIHTGDASIHGDASAGPEEDAEVTRRTTANDPWRRISLRQVRQEDCHVAYSLPWVH